MNLCQAHMTWMICILWMFSLMDLTFGHPRVKSNLRHNFYTVFGKSIKLEANFLFKRQVTSECKYIIFIKYFSSNCKYDFHLFDMIIINIL